MSVPTGPHHKNLALLLRECLVSSDLVRCVAGGFEDGLF